MESKIKIGLAGLGTVGSKVAEILLSSENVFKNKTGKKIEVTCVSALNKDKIRTFDISKVEWVPNTLDLSNRDDLDVIVELIGGDSGTAYELSKNSLNNKKHVVTANKALIAHHGYELTRLAEKNSVNLLFESAVAGGIPALKILKEAL